MKSHAPAGGRPDHQWVEIDPRTVPLRVGDLHGAPGYRVVVPDVDHPPAQTWLQFKDLPGGDVRVTDIRVARELRGQGLGRRLVERLLDEAGRGPGALQTTAQAADARGFWRAMRDRHDVIAVAPDGSPRGLDD